MIDKKSNAGHKEFTDEEVKLARDVDIITLADYLGMQSKQTGTRRGVPEYRMVEHDSLVFHKNLWYWNSQNLKGTSIDFLIKYAGMDYKSAVRTALAAQGYSHEKDSVRTPAARAEVQRSQSKPKPVHEAALKPITYSDSTSRVMAYLCKTRGIDRDIVRKLIREGLIKESAEKHNALFLGYDERRQLKYIFQRGTLSDPSKRFVGEVYGSDKAYAFSIKGTTDQVRVFESAIDALSYLTLHRNCKDTLQSLGGTTLDALEHTLAQNPNFTKIAVCLDNDDAGREGLAKIKQKFQGQYEVLEQLPKKKDWNEDLLFFLQSKMEMTM